MILANSRQHFLRTVQQLPALYEKYELASADRVVLGTWDHSFQMVVANLNKKAPVPGQTAIHRVREILRAENAPETG